MTHSNQNISEQDAHIFSAFITAYMKTNYRLDIGASGALQWFDAFHGKCTMSDFTQAMYNYAQESVSGKPMPAPQPGVILARLGGGSSYAWRHVLFMVRHYGSNYTVEFDDSRVAYAIHQFGGWPKFCETLSSSKTLPSEMMREFLSLYSAAPANTPAQPLIGAMGEASKKVAIKTKNDRMLINMEKPRLLRA